MRVAESHGKGVRGIVGLGWRVESEQECDHVLNLTFISASVADDCLLDLQRAVLIDGQIL
jgi:hypothetical protein